jgi:hypothetical protein
MGDSTTSILSALVGGGIAGVFCLMWSRWISSARNGASEAVLLRQNGLAILASHLCFLGGFLIGLSLCVFGCFEGNDWGGLALGIGAGCIAPVFILPLCALAGRRSTKEAFVAYAISIRVPAPVLYAVLICGSSALFWSLTSTPCR